MMTWHANRYYAQTILLGVAPKMIVFLRTMTTIHTKVCCRPFYLAELNSLMHGVSRFLTIRKAKLMKSSWRH